MTIRDQLIQQITGKAFVEEITDLMDQADVQYTDAYGEATYENLMKLLGESTEDTGAAVADDAAAQAETQSTDAAAE